jgi:hypothetical protein
VSGNPWTRGPWSLDESNRIVGADGETPVAEARRFTFEEAARVSADRRLQASAPEMAEALAKAEREMTRQWCRIAPQASNADYTENTFADRDPEIVAIRTLLTRIRGDAP